MAPVRVTMGYSGMAGLPLAKDISLELMDTLTDALELSLAALGASTECLFQVSRHKAKTTAFYPWA